MAKKVVVETPRKKPENPPPETPIVKPEPTKLSPCAHQTEEEIAAYYRNAKIGDVAVVM